MTPPLPAPGSPVRIRTDVGFVPLAGERGVVERVCPEPEMLPIVVRFKGKIRGFFGITDDMVLSYRRHEVEVIR